MLKLCRLSKARRLASLAAFVFASTSHAADELSVIVDDGTLEVKAGVNPVATYVWKDSTIPRPYFRDLFTPGSVRVSRRYPPREGEEATDHANLHPGLWLSFSALNGIDYWRNKAATRHVEFVEPVKEGPQMVVAFTVKNAYADGDHAVCTEICRHTIRTTSLGYLITYDSQFTSHKSITFGDQEEMGLGVRVTRDLNVNSGSGKIVNDSGQTNEAQVWGKPATWCDYGGTSDGKAAGLFVMPHPENFRPSRFHARDYGFMAANPFGIKSFGAGEESRIEVKPGETFRLRFGVLVHGAFDDLPKQAVAALREYVEIAKPPLCRELGAERQADR